jgi:hypothetical protein
MSELYERQIEAVVNAARDDREDAIIEAIAAHLPGLAPAIRALGAHVIDAIDIGEADCC